MNILEEIQPENPDNSITINVTKIYTNVDGTIINKAAVPVSFQKKVPVYLLNKFDKNGGYRFSSQETPVLEGMKFVRYFVRNAGYDFTQFSGFNDISTTLNPGDIAFLYTDNDLNPNFFCWIIQSLSGKPLNGVIENAYNLQIKGLKIFPEFISDYKEQIKIIQADQLGNYDSDEISQNAYRYPYKKNENFVRIPLQMCLTPFVGFASYIPFNTDSLSYQFDFKH